MDKGEGQAMKAHVSIDEESQTGPSIPWKTPQRKPLTLYVCISSFSNNQLNNVVIEIPPDAKVEVNSEAAKIQSDREKTVLQAVYYDTVYIPPSPAEADPEPDSQVSPKQIPLQDLSISHEEPSQPHQQPFLGIDPGMISGLLNVNSQTPPLYQQAYLPPQQHQPYMPQPQFPAYTNVAQGGGFIQQQQMLQTNAPANATQPFIQSKSQQQQYIHKR